MMNPADALPSTAGLRVQKMKAIRIHRHGGPDALQLDEIAVPALAPGQLLVRIRAASVNPGDIKVRAGTTPYMKPALPHTLGRDFSGVVHTVAPGVEGLRVGDEVFGVTPTGQEGAYAEFIAIDASLIANKPPQSDHAGTTALALTGLTALAALEETARLEPGETVLIHGAAGGVGSFAVQYAKSRGARVIATARRANHAYVARLGADQIIDYTSEDFAMAAPPCDVVLDLLGGEVFRRSLGVLRPGGRLVYVSAATAIPADARRDDVQVLQARVSRGRAQLERIASLLAQGAVSPPAIMQFPLERAREAHERMESRSFVGKLVLIPPSS
jgi:NADPH:quinone reductase-like Zn-dependent oxidoreductase